MTRRSPTTRFALLALFSFLGIMTSGFAGPVAGAMRCVDTDGDDLPDRCDTGYPFPVWIARPAVGDTPTVVANEGAGSCTSTFSGETVTVTCTPPSGTWICTGAAVLAWATANTVSASAKCAGGPSATVATSMPDWEIQSGGTGSWGWPFECHADFTGGATGYVFCFEPFP